MASSEEVRDQLGAEVAALEAATDIAHPYDILSYLEKFAEALNRAGNCEAEEDDDQWWSEWVQHYSIAAQEKLEAAGYEVLDPSELGDETVVQTKDGWTIYWQHQAGSYLYACGPGNRGRQQDGFICEQFESEEDIEE